MARRMAMRIGRKARELFFSLTSTRKRPTTLRGIGSVFDT